MSNEMQDCGPLNLPQSVSLAQQIACVKREIGMRTRVYPRWVSASRMTQAKADSELQAMHAVLDTLQEIEDEMLRMKESGS